LLCTGNGFRDGVVSSLIFISGKLLSYLILGGIAAYLGHLLNLNNVIPVAFISGLTLVMVGITLPFINRGGQCQSKRQIMGRGISLFVLGISTSLIPCPALATVFMLAAKKGVIVSGIAYGLVYGMGIIISPLLIAGGVISLISRRLKIEVSGFVPYLQGLSAMIIIIMGIRIILQEV
jgi:sulfite exporter TauE/SafE